MRFSMQTMEDLIKVAEEREKRGVEKGDETLKGTLSCVSSDDLKGLKATLEIVRKTSETEKTQLIYGNDWCAFYNPLYKEKRREDDQYEESIHRPNTPENR